MPAGDTDDSETHQEQGVPAAAGANPSPGWQVQWKMRGLIVCDGSLYVQDRTVFCALQWNRYWKATFGRRCEVTTTPASKGHTAGSFSSSSRRTQQRKIRWWALLSVCVITRGQWSVGSAM